MNPHLRFAKERKLSGEDDQEDYMEPYPITDGITGEELMERYENREEVAGICIMRAIVQGNA
jgi:hypothetical protein